MFLCFVLEIIGTVSFAISGAVVGLQKNMDVFGVSILGLTTATVGGVIRDLILGNFPPVAFRIPAYAITAICVSLVCFLPAVRKVVLSNKNFYNKVLLITDSAGLGLFAVIGVKIAMEAAVSRNLFMTVFVATMTAVGGGIMRDLLAGDVPFILMKHIYAVAAIAGQCVRFVLGCAGEQPFNDIRCGRGVCHKIAVRPLQMESPKGAVCRKQCKVMKIAIIGYSGSGKSTLAEIIGKKYSIPVLHLDKVNFLPGWVERNIDESRRIAEEFMKKDSWVIDGNYGKFFQKERLEAADRIIFLDFNRFSCLLRAYRRYIIHKGKTRSSAAEGCIEKFDGVFIRWILADGRTKAKGLFQKRFENAQS